MDKRRTLGQEVELKVVFINLYVETNANLFSFMNPLTRSQQSYHISTNKCRTAKHSYLTRGLQYRTTKVSSRTPTI